MRVVAVDIGGTHVRFAVAEVGGGRVLSLEAPTTLKTADFPDFREAWSAFVAVQQQALPDSAAIAIACPIRGEVLHLTNNPWIIRPAHLASELRLSGLLLINDFEAVGHAVATLDASCLGHVCGPDEPLPRHGIATIVGPGTGLGVGQVYRNGNAYEVVPCEGGHAAFAPLDRLEDALLDDLRTAHDRVSIERVVSGPGLGAIYRTLARRDGRTVTASSDQLLWQAALDGNDPLAATALDRFCAILGSVAGDLALANGPTAVVIAGGLGLRLADRLSSSQFAERFTAKGRFEALMRSIPVKVITHSQPGLYGAAAAFAKDHA